MKIDLTGLLSETLGRLRSYQSTETLNSILEDKTLLGYLNLTRELMMIHIGSVPYEDVVKFNEEHGLLDEVYYENLFYIPGKTKSLKANKAKVLKNRAAAYKLLYRYCKPL